MQANQRQRTIEVYERTTKELLSTAAWGCEGLFEREVAKMPQPFTLWHLVISATVIAMFLKLLFGMED